MTNDLIEKWRPLVNHITDEKLQLYVTEQIEKAHQANIKYSVKINDYHQYMCDLVKTLERGV
jgi:hypothetical protein